MNISRILIVLAGLGLLAACGNKGPLVMPQKPVPVEQPAAPTAPAPAAATPPAEASDTPAVPREESPNG